MAKQSYKIWDKYSEGDLYPKIANELQKLPAEPGCYLFYGANKKILYVGKAINLKSRVRSYWNASSWDDRPKLKFLVPKVHHIETIITKNEKEAI